MRRGVTRQKGFGRALVVALILGCSVGVGQGNAQSAARNCGAAVIDDWSKGGLDRTYSARCYREALAALPEDIRIYSSAPDDINQALAARVARSPQAVWKVAATRSAGSSAKRTEASGGLPAPLLLAGSLALVLLAFTSAGLALQRHHRR